MFKVTGRALSDVKVTKISLVDRGAVRQPFKIVKRDTNPATRGAATMNFSLAKLFKQARQAQPGARVAAIVASKSADQARVLKRMANAGFDPAPAVELDGQLVYARKGETVTPEAFAKSVESGLILKADESVAVVVEHVAKGTLGLTASDPEAPEAKSFAHRVTDSCVFPGVSNALDALTDAVWDAVYSSENSGDIAAAIDAAFTDAASYLKTLVGAIPAQAFKMEAFKSEGGKIILEIDQDETVIRFPMEGTAKDRSSGSTSMGTNGGSKGADPTSGSDIDGTPDSGLPGETRIRTMKDAPDANAAGQTSATKDDGKNKDSDKDSDKEQDDESDDTDTKDDADKKDSKASKSEAEPVATISKADFDKLYGVVTDLAGGIKALKNDFKSIATDIDDLQTRVSKSEAGTLQIAKKLKTTVPTIKADADREEIEKGEGDYGGLIDTGIDRSWLND